MRRIILVTVLALFPLLMVGCFHPGSQTTAGGGRSIEGTIHIATFSPSRFLQEATAKFARLHPGVKVVIDSYATIDTIKQKDPKSLVENYEKTLNTQMMSGKGADIIYLNADPYKRFVSRHLLADLNRMMESDPDYHADEYYTNIFNAVEIDHGLYTLPVEYHYDLLGSTARIDVDDRSWNWQEFTKAAQNGLHGENRCILPDSDEELFNRVFSQNYNHFVNESEKTVNFDSEEFINLLRLCENLAEKRQIAHAGETSEYSPKNTLFQCFDGIASLTILALHQHDLYRWPADDKGGYYFGATMCAINNASSNKALAWEFLKFLISDEMQTSPSIGFPVNKSAFQKKCAIETEYFCQDKTVDLSKEERIKLMKKAMSFNEAMVKDLKVCYYEDPQIRKMVEAETHTFFLGKDPAEVVAHSLQNSVGIYLQE